MARSRSHSRNDAEQALVPAAPTSVSRSSTNRAVQPIRPEVTVLDASGSSAPDASVTRGALAATIARAAIDLAPDVIRAIEGARTRRGGTASNLPATTTSASPARSTPATLLQAVQPQAAPVASPVYTRSTRVTEREFDLRTPLVRRVVVREATSWESLIPPGSLSASVSQPAPTDASGGQGRWMRTGLVGIGGALAVAALGVLANRTRS